MRRYYAEDGYSFDETGARRALRELIEKETLGRVWVAEDAGDVIGYLAVTLGFSLEYRGRDAFIDELYIAADHRGRGLGREALEIAQRYCRDQGARALHLEVERHRTAARELYRRIGFEDHDRGLMTLWLDHA